MDNEKIEVTVARHDEQIKELKKDSTETKEMIKLIYEISSDIKLLFQQGSIQNEKLESLDSSLNAKIDKVDGKVNKMDKDLNEVKNQDDKKDANKWREVAKYIGLLIIGAIFGLALKKIGLV